MGWYSKEEAIRAAVGKLLVANNHIVPFFAGHAHRGLCGWNDTVHGIHEVILPCVSDNNDRKFDKAPGIALREFRPAWVRVDVHSDRLILNYKPVGAAPSATKELSLPGSRP